MPKMTPFMTYVAGQQAAGRLLKQRDEADAKFRELGKQLKRDSRAGGLDLFAFLLKPMQRVCRYHLLFKTLLQYTPSDHADYSSVLDAWTRAEELAARVNQSVAEREDLEHLEWLQTHVLLDGLEDVRTVNILNGYTLKRERILLYNEYEITLYFKNYKCTATHLNILSFHTLHIRMHIITAH